MAFEFVSPLSAQLKGAGVSYLLLPETAPKELSLCSFAPFLGSRSSTLHASTPATRQTEQQTPPAGVAAASSPAPAGFVQSVPEREEIYARTPEREEIYAREPGQEPDYGRAAMQEPRRQPGRQPVPRQPRPSVQPKRNAWDIKAGSGVQKENGPDPVYPEELLCVRPYEGRFSRIAVEEGKGVWKMSHEGMLGWLSQGKSLVKGKKGLRFILSYAGIAEDLLHLSEGFEQRSAVLSKILKDVPQLVKNTLFWPIADKGYGMEVLRYAMDRVGARMVIFCGLRGSEVFNKVECKLLEQQGIGDGLFVAFVEGIREMQNEPAKYEATISYLRNSIISPQNAQ